MADPAQDRRGGPRADRRRAREAPGGRGRVGARRAGAGPGREGLRAGAAGAPRPTARRSPTRDDRAQGAIRGGAGRARRSGSKREADEARRREALDEVAGEADQRVAAAEQRAAEAEAAAEEAHAIAVKLEAEIEERVMQGTEDVRREAEERVRKLVEKVEGEAEEKARGARRGAAAGRVGADPRAGRAARGARPPRRRGRDQGERQRARREALAAAEETAPAWAARAEQPSARRLPNLLSATRGVRRQARRMREVRIKDTLSGELVALDPDDEVGIYACGPTVYSRIHIGNARPFVVFSLLARFLRSRGVRGEAGRQRHRHQRQDLRRGRGGRRALGGVRRADDRGLLRGHRSARPGPARCGAAGDGDDRRDRRADRRPGRARARLRVGRRRLLPRAQLRGLRQALQPPARGHGPGRGGGLGVAQGETRSTSRSGRRTRRARTRAGTRPGARAARPGTSSAR